MTTNLKKMLGSGIFSISEAALYARVSPPTTFALDVRDQFGRYRLSSAISDGRQTFKLSRLGSSCRDPRDSRSEKDSVGQVRQAIKTAKMMYKTRSPFRKKHVTLLDRRRNCHSAVGRGLRRSERQTPPGNHNFNSSSITSKNSNSIRPAWRTCIASLVTKASTSR